ncbi:hypothetical protein CALVIDRAFT_529959 [Calocera viscosa TUFC12733]|uniref:BZIP domain-containing protein n=1 Tax=Calocera viscosa (strain TUFC12733) TaxID=1330018 RepID=A0A167IGY2_CALVF|nr:hypothetical protein CALVIDRAFT_529959 [Calocera viscosa TUFC12733]
MTTFMPGPDVAPFRLPGLSLGAFQQQDALGLALSGFGLDNELVPNLAYPEPSSQELRAITHESDILQSTIAALFGSYPGGAASAHAEADPPSSQNTQDVFDQFLNAELYDPAPDGGHVAHTHHHHHQAARTVTPLALPRRPAQAEDVPDADLLRDVLGSPQASPTVVDSLFLLSPEFAVDPMVLHTHATRSSTRLQPAQPQPQPQPSAASSPLSEVPSPLTPLPSGSGSAPRPTRPLPRARSKAAHRIIPYEAPVQPRKYEGDSLTARKKAQANVLERVDPKLREGVKRLLDGKPVFSQSTEEEREEDDEEEDDELRLESEEEPEPPRKKQKGKAAAAVPPRAASAAASSTAKLSKRERAAIAAEVLAAAEETVGKAGDKRYKNTMSQRRSREKKRQEMAVLSEENDRLREELARVQAEHARDVERLEAQIGQLNQQVYELLLAGLGQPAQ